MKESEVRALLFEALAEIAPEAAPDTLRGEEDLREALDLDSMDFLNLVSALHRRTGRDIPEADYPKLFTLDGILTYFADRSG